MNPVRAVSQSMVDNLLIPVYLQMNIDLLKHDAVSNPDNPRHSDDGRDWREPLERTVPCSSVCLLLSDGWRAVATSSENCRVWRSVESCTGEDRRLSTDDRGLSNDNVKGTVLIEISREPPVDCTVQWW